MIISCKIGKVKSRAKQAIQSTVEANGRDGGNRVICRENESGMDGTKKRDRSMSG